MHIYIMKRLALLLLVVASTQAVAGYEDGMDAYKAHRFDEALKEFTALSERGYPQADFMLGLMYTNAEGVARDPSKAMHYLLKAADAGRAEAMSIIGSMYESDKSDLYDQAKALEWYRKGAEKNDSDAMRFLSHHYLAGTGVAQDNARALEWMKQAADRDSTLAKYELAVMYELGKGVARDEAKARLLYRAIKAPYGEKFYRLGGMYETGRGGAQDLALAFEQYEKAAKAGSAAGMKSLGAMYAAGRGVAQDYKLAMLWFERAADFGNPEAMYRGGLMLANGLGGPKNEAEAQNWFADAAEHGHAGALRRLARKHDAKADYGNALAYYCRSAAAEDRALAAFDSEGIAGGSAPAKAYAARYAIVLRCAAQGSSAATLRTWLEGRLEPGAKDEATALASRMMQAGNVSQVLAGYVELDAE